MALWPLARQIERKKAVSLGGLYLRLGHDGPFAPIGDIGLGASPGDGCLVVTNLSGAAAYDPGVVVNALNQGGAVPLPIQGRWTVSFAALTAAIAAGTRVALTPFTG